MGRTISRCFLGSAGFAAIACVSQAQNLVPNPSFEAYTECPSEYGQFLLVQDWFWPMIGNPDYYNTCNVVGPMGVPHNVFGYQQPASGNAYCGLWGYGGTNTVDGLHEIIGTHLPAPLQIGQTYWASFKVSWSSGYPFVDAMTGFASNKLGILLSNDSLIGENDWLPWPNRAQVHTEAIVTDSLTWTIISGQFMADSAYQYLYVGNFFGDDSTMVIDVQPEADDFSYYYVDDVCLSMDAADCPLANGIGERSEARPRVRLDGPSNAIVITGLPAGIVSLALTDMAGRQLMKQHITAPDTEDEFHVPLGTPLHGMAILQLENGAGVWSFKLLPSL